MFRKGHRLFSISSLCLILLAAIHGISHFSPPPDSLITTGLMAALQSYTFNLGLGTPSMMDTIDSMSLSVFVMLLWLGLNNLYVARYTVVGDNVVRKICTLNVVALGALVMVFAYYNNPPTAIALGIIEIMFVVSRVRLRRSRMKRQLSASHPPHPLTDQLSPK